MPLYIKMVINLLIWIVGNKHFQALAERILREIAERNDFVWDDELLDNIFGKEPE